MYSSPSVVETIIDDTWGKCSRSGTKRRLRVSIDETFEQAASSEEFGHFCEAVRQLPLQARRVFVLKKVYGYSQREIVRELGIAESTVEKHVALAVRRCAAYLREESWQASVRLDQVEAHHE